MKKIKLACASMALVVALCAPQAAYAKMLPTPVAGDSTSTGTTVGANGEADSTATGSATVEATLSGETKNITLNEAMDLALANSADVLSAKNDLENAKLNKESALRKVKDYSKFLSDSNINMQNLNYAADLYKQQLIIYENAYELQCSAAKLQAIQGYYKVLCDGKSETAALYSYTKAENQLKVVESRYKQGMATKLEKLQAETQLNTAKVALDAARTTTVQDKRSFNILIGQDIETNWSPTSQLAYEPMLIEDVDAKVEEMVEAAPSLKIAEATLEIARLQYVNNSAGKGNTDVAKMAALEYDTAKIDYNNTMSTTRAGAKSMLENLSLAHSQYKIYEESQNLLEEVYRLAQLQYDNGLNTQNDVQAAATDIMSNDSARLSALLQYNVAKTAIEQNIISTGSSSTSSSSK